MAASPAETGEGEARDQDLAVGLHHDGLGHVAKAKQHRGDLAAAPEGSVERAVAVVAGDGDHVGRVGGAAGAPDDDEPAVRLDGDRIWIVEADRERRADDAALAKGGIEGPAGQVAQHAED